MHKPVDLCQTPTLMLSLAYCSLEFFSAPNEIKQLKATALSEEEDEGYGSLKKKKNGLGIRLKIIKYIKSNFHNIKEQ